MDSRAEQKGHRLHNQLKLLSIKTEKKERKARQHGGKLSELGGGAGDDPGGILLNILLNILNLLD